MFLFIFPKIYQPIKSLANNINKFINYNILVYFEYNNKILKYKNK